MHSYTTIEFPVDLLNKDEIHIARSSFKNHLHGSNYWYLWIPPIVRWLESNSRRLNYNHLRCYLYSIRLGMTRGRFNGTTWPTMGTVDTTILYVDVSVPIGVTLSTNRQNCFRRKYRTNPANLQTNMYALLGCEVEIIDKIINQQLISLGSNRVLQEWARIIVLDTSESSHGTQKPK